MTKILCYVAFMSGEQRKGLDWREAESMEDAASRLLRVLDERSKKRKTLAGGGNGAGSKLQNQPKLAADKRADGESDKGVGTLDGSIPMSDSRRGEVAGGFEYGGRAAREGSEPISFEANGCARPATPDEAIGGDRDGDYRHSGGLG